MCELKRYDANTDEYVPLTQEYFDTLNSRFLTLRNDYSKNHPDDYVKFVKENWKIDNA